jgi:hypothetical protein
MLARKVPRDFRAMCQNKDPTKPPQQTFITMERIASVARKSASRSLQSRSAAPVLFDYLKSSDVQNILAAQEEFRRQFKPAVWSSKVRWATAGPPRCAPGSARLVAVVWHHGGVSRVRCVWRAVRSVGV